MISKEYIYIYDINIEPRGFHAHTKLEQVVVALAGSCEFELDNGKNKEIIKLNSLEVMIKELENLDYIVFYPGIMRTDINGKKIESFNVNVKDRFEILNTIFIKQNCICSPGMVMRKDTFSTYLYPLDNSMCLHQDTQMHVKLLLNGEPKFLDENLILYRFDDNVGNISRSFISLSRDRMETEILMDTFLNIDDINLLKKVFSKEIDKIKLESKMEYLEFFR